MQSSFASKRLEKYPYLIREGAAFQAMWSANPRALFGLVVRQPTNGCACLRLNVVRAVFSVLVLLSFQFPAVAEQFGGPVYGAKSLCIYIQPKRPDWSSFAKPDVDRLVVEKLKEFVAREKLALEINAPPNCLRGRDPNRKNELRIFIYSMYRSIPPKAGQVFVVTDHMGRGEQYYPGQYPPSVAFSVKSNLNFEEEATIIFEHIKRNQLETYKSFPNIKRQ